jgi:hypothetical protein
MKQSGKSYSITSTNPKMASKGQVTQRYEPTLRAVNGYDSSGRLVNPGGLIPKDVAVTITPEAPAAPQAPAAPAAPAKTGLEYDAYDTELEAEAKAPTAMKGQAPNVTAMRSFAAPTDVKYYGESYKGEAQTLADKRQAAYERKVMNEAVRTGNALPTIEKGGKVTMGQTAGELRSKFVDDLQQSKVDLARRANAPIQQAAAAAKITDSGASGFNSGMMRNALTQGKVLAQMSFDDYLKKRKESN